MKLISQYKGLRQENYILCFGRLVTSMGAMVWPMLTMILNQKMGMSAEHIAWVIAAVGILSLPANLIGGKMADHFNKKMNIVYLDSVSVVCYIACAVIPLSAKSVVLMSVASVCQSMEHPSYNALTADITAMEDRERAYSLQYLCMNLGLVMSPTIAGILLRDHLWLVFLISGAAIGCSTIVIFCLVKDIAPVRDTGSKAVYQAERKGESLWTVLRENKLIVLYMVLVSGYFATYQMYNYLMPLDLARLHGDGGAVIFGSITSVNCVAVVIFTPLFTRMFPWITETVKMMLGQILLMAGFCMFLLCLGRIPFYYAAIIVLTLGEVLSTLAESPYLTKRMPASHRGRINGVSEVLRTGITSVYQLAIGFVYKMGGSQTAWITVMIIGMVFIILCGVLVVKDRKEYKNLYL